MNEIRKKRLESLLKREIGMILLREIKDPRIHFVTVTDVSMTNDYKIAHIYVSIMGDEKEKENNLRGLQNAAGFIRKLVGESIKIRYNPELIFKIDDSFEKQNKILKILKEIEENKLK
ncbi:MAG: 30S ribosome-binding factor RbfA [Candidatus Goldbacteria bacterium]|nr:30S ribosome-binding factor RbfA [Candidatus Goldiibacteriota bacterium]